MTAQQLKNSILQMAVQGKLVPQNPDDEPASVLLERIRAEKQKLIKEGKIKKDKKSSEIFRGASRNLPYMYYEQVGKEIRDISDEIPFDIPESWEWVRLGQIGETNIGLTYRPSDKTTSGGILVLRSSNIQNDKMDYNDNVYVSCDIPERAMICKGDILICARNGSRALVGKCAIVDKDGMAFGAFMAKFSSIFNPYIKLFIDSPIFRQQLDGVKTETINQITQDMLKNQLCPLPPVNEQMRIVDTFFKLLPFIEKYSKVESQLTALNTTFPEALKKSILQEAVQGRLVPQNPDDEPASVLLERIRAEKQKLIKEGKIKKDKHESQIIISDKIPYEIVDGEKRCITDEVPFELPDSWCWCRLKSIINAVSARRVHQSDWKNSGIPFYRAREIAKLAENGSVDNEIFISEELFAEYSKSGVPQSGDLMVTAVGTLGKTYIVKDTDRFYYKDASVICFENYGKICSEYLRYLMMSPYMETVIKDNSSGTTVGTITLVRANEYLIPLPPLSEQKRIVTKIEELVKYCQML